MIITFSILRKFEILTSSFFGLDGIRVEISGAVGVRVLSVLYRRLPNSTREPRWTINISCATHILFYPSLVLHAGFSATKKKKLKNDAAFIKILLHLNNLRDISNTERGRNGSFIKLRATQL